MQKEIDMVALLCNKIAQHLVAEEYVDNEQSIQEHGVLLHGIKRCSDEEVGSSQWKERSASQVALEMVNLAMKISEEYATRSKLAYNCKLDIHRRESQASSPETFPILELEKIDPTTEKGKNQLKSLLLRYNTSHPAEVKNTRLRMGISHNQWNEWLVGADKSYKHSSLRQKVISSSTNGPLTLGNFKRLAKRVYASKYFRPRDSWCRKFITRERLQDRVNMRPLD